MFIIGGKLYPGLSWSVFREYFDAASIVCYLIFVVLDFAQAGRKNAKIGNG